MVQGYGLKINKVAETDTGTYTCRICNSIGGELGRKTASYPYSYDHETADTLNSNAERDECDERSGFLKVLGKIWSLVELKSIDN